MLGLMLGKRTAAAKDAPPHRPGTASIYVLRQAL